MPTAPTIFRSSDASAPVLTGQVGSLIGVLDACLVNGYGAKSALGWTTEFTGTNLRVYRNVTASGATGFRLRVDDTAANSAVFRGAESASAISTLTNTFPSTGQSADTNQKAHKSNAAGATVRDWVLIGDAKRFYLGIDTQSTTPRSYAWYFFGDFISHRPADTANAALFAYSDATPSSSGGITYGATAWATTLAGPPATNAGWVARAYTGTAGAVPVAITRLGGVANLATGLAYPGVIANEFIYARCYLNEGGVGTRGEMPGLFVSYHTNAFSGTGVDAVPMNSIPDMPGRTFLLFNSNFGGGQTSHVLLFETTGDSW